MPKQTQPSDPFIFVDTPGEKETKEIRKKIRSRAAKHSHEVGRKSYKTGQSTQLVKLGERSVTSPLWQHSRRTSTASATMSERLSLNRRSTSESLEQTDDSTSISYPVSNGMCFPVPEQAFYRSTIAFMWKWMLDAWNMLDVTEPEREEALIWVQRLTLTSPPYFYMNMLSCCTTLAEQGLFDPGILPLLMGQTVRAINEALSTAESAIEIGVILAVGRIALRECLRGNLEVGSRIHRPAQARMLAMAGGLDALAVPILVKKHIMWAERLVLKRTGISLADLHPGAVRQDAIPVDAGSDERVLHTYYLTHRQPVRDADPQMRPG